MLIGFRVTLTRFLEFLPTVYDHAMLYLIGQDNGSKNKSKFKFIISVVHLEGFEEVVIKSWREPLEGRHMYVIWNKLIRL